jgi:L-aspartate oxidase
MIYDYLIVGAGVAGLSAGRNLPRDKKVLIVCKKSPWECNTFYAQGGITSAVDKNDIKLHIKDTLEAGVYLNDKNMVRILSENSIDVIQDLASSGMKFDLEEDGNIAYTKEAAHSRSRVIHADGDATGRELHSFLLSNCEHQIMSDSIVIDLLYQDGIC